MSKASRVDIEAMLKLCEWALTYVQLPQDTLERCRKALRDGIWLKGGDAPDTAEDCVEMAISDLSSRGQSSPWFILGLLAEAAQLEDARRNHELACPSPTSR